MAEDAMTRPEETAAEAEMRFTEAGSLDMENRDPKNLNSHIAYSFHDVIGEPETAHSAPAVWIRAYRCFNGSANCCYIFLTYLCAIPAACCWGCNLACLAFEHIWCLTPSIKYCKINLYPLMRLYSFAIQCLCVPFFEAVALIFSKVGIHKVDQPPQYKSRHDEFEAMMTQI